MTDLTDSSSLRPHSLRLPELSLSRPEAGLYLVSTPIGNLKDMTLRAIEVLGGVDAVYCEDTRVSAKLMAAFGLKTPLYAYHEHNAAVRAPEILARLEKGEAVALISDAGTPLISDPGYRLVSEVVAAGHRVFPVPGASALLAGVVASGLPSDRILFCGFAPNKQGARQSFFAEVAEVEATLVFYESPNRIAASLKDMALVLGDHRQASVGRELTKRFETFHYGTLKELAEEAEITEKGEFVVVVAPPEKQETDMHQVEDMVRTALATLSVSRAAAEVALKTGLPKRDIYQLALEISQENQSGNGKDDR